MNYLEGILKSTLFFNEENGYSVLKVEITDTTENNLLYFEPTIVVCGFFPPLETGVKYRFFGEMKDHPKYGTQYSAVRYERQMDHSRDGLIDYLSSDLFKGIGPKTAGRIIDVLGPDAIDLIIADPTVLHRVPKLSKAVKTTLPEALLANRKIESTLVWLYGFDISPKMAMRIYRRYGYQAVDVIKNNPYLLMDEVEGIGFRRADEIGLKIGVAFDDPMRIRAVLFFLLDEYVSKYGDTVLERSKLMEYAAAYLRAGEDRFVEEETIRAAVENLLEEGKIVAYGDWLSLARLFRAEETLGKRLRSFSDPLSEGLTPERMERYLSETETMSGITYTPDQREAIITALSHPFVILTGGPGTGKTTVIKAIVDIFRQIHQGNPTVLRAIRLAAPTGKAAKRLFEATGWEASTIHRLLGFDYEGHFTFDEHNRLPCRLLIIDEASMMDVLLARQLFSALPDKTKIVIVGDENQLPSVGPGQVLSDLIASGLFPVVRLTKIHRQAANSSIISMAYDILNQNLSENVLQNHPDRLYYRAYESAVPGLIVKTIREAIEEGHDLWEDIQVLIPMYKGPAGIDAVNNLLQSTFNAENAAIAIRGKEKTFFYRDKVLQLVNQPEDGVMNGDLGIVAEILDEREMIVDFGGNMVKYNVKDFDRLTLAYAVSVHKAQGSEYKIVILPLLRSQSILLKRKLLYTAVTRAKDKLVMIGEYQALRHGVLGIENPRKTLLKTMLTQETAVPPADRLTIEDFL
ncbi:MAG TPA: ATP-dependent RecD-like DNA helicase [Candidatus Izemoplasmatales bacterium]|nr:ATP-dependent RecD-like DNA helicase [Candidatus Izemoplasmatales bacterium]